MRIGVTESMRYLTTRQSRSPYNMLIFPDKCRCNPNRNGNKLTPRSNTCPTSNVER